MARLPKPGGDNNTWGTVLNDFLSQAHNADGSLRPVDYNTLANKPTAADIGAVSAGGLDAATAALVNNGSSTTASALKATLATALPPLAYGAKGDGTTDDTAALNAALAAAKAQGSAVVDGGGHTYKATGRITVDSVTLRNVHVLLSGGAANVRLTGTAPGLRDSVLVADATPANEWGPDGAIINLLATTKAVIDNVEVTATAQRRGVQCTTRADYTRINNLRTYTAWGILFNDTSFIDRTNIEGVDYSSQSIGTGLTVTNSEFFGPSNAAWTGDAIEINVPAMRFSNVQVLNCGVHQTYTSSNVGIGFGFANVDHVIVEGCFLENVQSSASAIHTELCTDVKITNNTVKNCRSGVDIGGDVGALISGNRFDSCWEFSVKSQSAGASTDSADIVDNTFIGLKSANGVTAFNDIVMGNSRFVTIARNKFLGMGEAGLVHINTVAYGSPAIGITHMDLRDNVFANITGFAAASLLFLDPTTTNLHSSGNDFTTYTGPTNQFIDRVAKAGICEDYYTGPASQVAGSSKGLRGMVGGTPQGWVSGAAGRVMDDVVNGVRYKWDATAGVWTIPGGAYSNPLRLGSYYLWVDTAGTLRIKATAPTSATDGTSVGSQT